MADFPQQLQELIKRFDQNIEAYQSQVYNETQVRREFIDPFFEVLGWDVVNKAGYAEAYKDVIHEDAIKIGGITKAPDYCFCIGGARKFFVEAKKPAVSIKENFECTGVQSSPIRRKLGHHGRTRCSSCYTVSHTSSWTSSN